MPGMPAQHNGLRSRWLSWRLSGRRRLPSLHRYCRLHSMLQRLNVRLKLATHVSTSLNASNQYQPLHEGCPQQGTNAFLAESLQRLAT